MSAPEPTPITIGEGHPNEYKLGETGFSRIYTNGSHVTIGDMKFDRSEFTRAFEGSFQTGYGHVPSRKFANPVPLGVASFAITLLCLSLVNVGARGTSNAAALTGLFWFTAGLICLITGMWSIVIENVWAATLLASFGGFWIGYGCIVVDAFGITTTYGTKVSSVLGIWVLAWAIFTTMMWLTTLKSTWPLCIVIFLVVVTLVLLSAANFSAEAHPTSAAHLTKAGGYTGILASVGAYFIVYSGLCTKENSYWVPPVLLMPGAVTE